MGRVHRGGAPRWGYDGVVATTSGDRRTDSGIEIKPVYRPADAGEPPADPGEFPYTRGVRPDGYRTRPWTMRQYAGFGSADETNERFRLLLHRGQGKAARGGGEAPRRLARARAAAAR